ncbi:kinase-like protein [Marasmius fiardii PR-910]|nr:kinase-like protein [Marasmius fiardii PR-910]
MKKCQLVKESGHSHLYQCNYRNTGTALRSRGKPTILYHATIFRYKLLFYTSAEYMSTSNINTSSPPAADNLMVNKISPFIGAVEDQWGMYSDDPSDYTIGSPIGFGASSIVYAAKYQPKDSSRPPIPCALKVPDLDSLRPHSLALLQRETILMSLSKHPNVLRVRGSWMVGHKLYIALRLMNKGSAADIMRYGWQGGLEEEVIKCILKQTLKGLNYLHINGFIHRDVKAANLLIDDDGTVLLGDLGVAADLSEDSSETMDPSAPRSSVQNTPSEPSSPNPSQHVAVSEPGTPVRPKMGKRKSFVGTPCWMSPELIQGKHYDSAADIWSFGITALELSLGRPPRSRESPQKVLLRTIQDPPPILDRNGGEYKYSKAFQEFVATCLVKDPLKRPTAEQLLQSSFLKGAKEPFYLISKILKDLPPLAHRQERRILPNPQTRSSVDSWDFTTTVHSLPLNPSFLSQDVGTATSNDNEPILQVYLNEAPTVSSRSHSRSVSFAQQNPVVEDEEELLDLHDVESRPSSAVGSNSLSITFDNDTAVNESSTSSPASMCMTLSPPSPSTVQFSGNTSPAIDVASKVPVPQPQLISSPHDNSRPVLPKLSSTPSRGRGRGLWAKIKLRSH